MFGQNNRFLLRGPHKTRSTGSANPKNRPRRDPALQVGGAFGSILHSYDRHAVGVAIDHVEHIAQSPTPFT